MRTEHDAPHSRNGVMPMPIDEVAVVFDLLRMLRTVSVARIIPNGARVAIVLAIQVLLGACNLSDAGLCRGPADCAPVDAPPCDICAPVATEVCVQSACVAPASATVDVRATFVVDRSVESAVRGLAWALAVTDRPCDAFVGFRGFSDELNVLASGQKSLSGGGFHPDVALAPVPTGRVVVLALGTSAPGADGDVIASGCLEAEAQGSAVDVGPVFIEP